MSQFSINEAQRLLRSIGVEFLMPPEQLQRAAQILGAALDEAYAAGIAAIDTTNKAAMATGTVRPKPR